MESNDDPDGPEDGLQSVADLDIALRSKISPHLRAAVMAWELERTEARRAGNHFPRRLGTPRSSS